MYLKLLLLFVYIFLTCSYCRVIDESLTSRDYSNHCKLQFKWNTIAVWTACLVLNKITIILNKNKEYLFTVIILHISINNYCSSLITSIGYCN